MRRVHDAVCDTAVTSSAAGVDGEAKAGDIKVQLSLCVLAPLSRILVEHDANQVLGCKIISSFEYVLVK